MSEEDKLSSWIKKTLTGKEQHLEQQSKDSQKPFPKKPFFRGSSEKRHENTVLERGGRGAGTQSGRWRGKGPGGTMSHLTAKGGSAAPQVFHSNTSIPVRPHGKMRVIPLGGLEEVGKNMMVVEFWSPGAKEATDIIIVDMGLQFPEQDMLGIDYVIPDITYLKGKLDKIRGVVLTHGHLDHIGAIPYLFQPLGQPPFYGMKLTLGLVKKRLEEFELEKDARLHAIDFEHILQLGSFQLELFRVNHSFPDAAGIIIKSPAGTIVHTGDFKFDFTPWDKKPAHFAKIARLAEQNVIALFSDSTNATKPGHTISELQVGETLNSLIKNISGRIIIATFASSIGRIQQIVDAALDHGRKVYMSGRSIVDNVEIARTLGYIKAPANMIKDIRHSSVKAVDAPNSLILTTGSQGESLSALARMAMGDHKHIQLKKGDTVIFSSSPIIGNERAITSIINNLCQMGVSAISNSAMDVHTSGHGQQEDLKLMINLVKPHYVVPIHGELFMRMAHKQLAENVGYPEEKAVLISNGNILEISEGKLHVLKEKVDADYVMIDGRGGGSVGNQVLMERQIMASNGILAVLFQTKDKKLLHSPNIVSRGFIYLQESQEILEAVRKEAEKAYLEIIDRDKKASRQDVKNYVGKRLDHFIHRKIEKSPLIIPIIIESS